MQCWCGLPILASPDLIRMHSEKGGPLFCPLGHQSIRVETDNMKLQKKLDGLLAQLSQARANHEKELRILKSKHLSNMRKKK